jgi:hypothetical protein
MFAAHVFYRPRSTAMHIFDFAGVMYEILFKTGIAKFPQIIFNKLFILKSLITNIRRISLF